MFLCDASQFILKTSRNESDKMYFFSGMLCYSRKHIGNEIGFEGSFDHALYVFMIAVFQKKIKEWQDKGANMTQAEGEAAQREYGQMQQRYQKRQMDLEQELQKQKVDLMTDLRKKVEDFLKEYNKEKGYAFILSYEPGFMLYYKDTLYDVTSDVIAGLNKKYKTD